MKTEFEEYREILFEIVIGENHHDKFLYLINLLHNQGKTKKEIYDLFLDFHVEIQLDERTKKNEKVYNRLSDFMDGFTDSGKGFKILPDEPEI